MWHHVDFDLARKNPQSLADLTGQWITQHDPEEYVYRNWTACMNHLLHNTEFVNTNIPPGYKYHPWSIGELLTAANEGKPVVDEGDWS